MKHFRHARLAAAEVRLKHLADDYLLWRNAIPVGEIDEAQAEQIDEVIMTLERIAGYVWVEVSPWNVIPF
jgi:hypothetical protein